MGFEEFLPESCTEIEEPIIESTEKKDKISEEQFYDVIVSKKPDWQQIIYDLISTEQLDPWDIDLVVLTKKYFEKIIELEEHDYYISSKVLLAAALLLRIKSEFLLNKHIRSVDDILFGKKEDKKYVMERIEINEDDLPILTPKTPLPRAKKVTLIELMSALNKAINTEARRIRKEVEVKRAKKLSEVDFPTFRKIDLKDRIKQIYARILTSIKKKEEENKVCYSSLVGAEREEKVACFLPILHLSNTKKLWLEQEKHLEDIWIYLYEYFEKNRSLFIKAIEFEESVEEAIPEESENIEHHEDPLEKARKKRDEKKMLEQEARKELEEELKKDISAEVADISKEISDIYQEQKIEDKTGFNPSEI